MIGTLAWDLSGTGDETDCIDIDPDMLYHLEALDGTDAAWTTLQEATVSSLTDDSTLSLFSFQVSWKQNLIRTLSKNFLNFTESAHASCLQIGELFHFDCIKISNGQPP